MTREDAEFLYDQVCAYHGKQNNAGEKSVFVDMIENWTTDDFYSVWGHIKNAPDDYKPYPSTFQKQYNSLHRYRKVDYAFPSQDKLAAQNEVNRKGVVWFAWVTWASMMHHRDTGIKKIKSNEIAQAYKNLISRYKDGDLNKLKIDKSISHLAKYKTKFVSEMQEEGTPSRPQNQSGGSTLTNIEQERRE